MPNEPQISASGTASVIYEADIAYVSLFIITDGILLTDAIKKARDKAEEVVRVLHETYSGIEEIEVKDLYIGQSGGTWRPDKADLPQPQMILSLLVILPPLTDLAINVVDTAIRLGCVISNPLDAYHWSHPRGVILFGLMQYEQAEQEAIEAAILSAKENAARYAEILTKRVGEIRQVFQIETLGMKLADEDIRRNKNILAYPTRYISVSPTEIEISAKVSLTFELMD